MKKIITILFGIALVYSCSTNENSATTDLPLVPASLTASVISANQISLSWIDNSTNETGFKIERKIGGGAYAIIGTTVANNTSFNDNELISNTTYTYRVHSFNSVGNSTYSNEITVSTPNSTGTTINDIDGNVYQLVSICNQTWIKSNLDVTKYRDGTPIPQVSDPTQWKNLTTGAWCYYQNNTSIGVIYGKLYNWYAVIDPRGLAPKGYHIPSNTEWATLITCLGDYGIAGGKMKEIGLTHWITWNTGADNSSGFTGIPGGCRDYAGFFINMDLKGYWWSSTEIDASNVWVRSLNYDSSLINNDQKSKISGYSVRCLKD